MPITSRLLVYNLREIIVPVFCFTVLSCASILSAQPAPEALTVFTKPPVEGKRITPYLRYQVDTAWKCDELRRARLASIRTEADLLQFQRETRENLLDAIGGLPDSKTPLNPHITGTLNMDGYRIEKLVFESLPGFHVTSLVYVPDGPTVRRPAVLVACGHAPTAKSYPAYQKLCGRLAKRGYIVLCWDPIGQGERSQFFDQGRADSRYNRVCGEHAVLGNAAYLAGANLARWEVWDGIRALDYLYTRPDVDSTRISLTGSSGGGFQTAFIGALETRIGVVAPSCYITALPMRMNNRIFVDPDSDPEQDVYRMISSGIDHPGLMLLVFPRPLFLSAAIEDFFPIEGTRKSYREIAALYNIFDIPERIAISEGFHSHEYSDHNQNEAFAFIDSFNAMPVHAGLDSTRVLTDQELWCTRSGQVLTEFTNGKNLMDIIRDYYHERKGSPKVSLESVYYGDYYPGIRTWPVVRSDGRLPLDTIAWEKTGSTTTNDVVIDHYLIHHSGRLTIPLLHIRRQNDKGDRVLLWFTSRGKVTQSDWQTVMKYLDTGYQVVSFDFRGLGENTMLYRVLSIDDPSLAKIDFAEQYFSPISGVLANYIYNSLLTGRPYFLQMIEDAEITARFVSEKLGARIWITAPGDAYTLASYIADVFPGVKLLEDRNESVLRWSTIIEEKRETWPIQNLLPFGAYIR
ncbi:alpha/beta hydrolase family protein [bacterium]|nr:alpha/beta hydrolase family protein [bacterium]